MDIGYCDSARSAARARRADADTDTDADADADADRAAYSDVVSGYAALGWDGVREVARVVTAVTSGRG